MNREDRLAKDGAGEDAILFYGPRNDYGEFSNFSRHTLWLPNPFTGEETLYKTSEHRYQAMKGRTEAEHDWVNASNGPGMSKDRGRKVTLRDGWGNSYGDLCWYVMVETVMAKFTQNGELASVLRHTGDRHLYEDSPTDDIWGWRYRESYAGKNLLGEALMYVRRFL